MPDQRSQTRIFAPYARPEPPRVPAAPETPAPAPPPSPAPRRSIGERLKGWLLETKPARMSRFLPDAREARRRTGKSLLAQYLEIRALGRGIGEITPTDYYQFELFDDALTPAGEKWRFVTERRLLRTARKANRTTWAGMVGDKLLAAALFEGLGIPAPPLYAAYVHGSRGVGRALRLGTPAEVAAFLRSGAARYPLFGKPFVGRRGDGASLIDAYDDARDCLLLASGEVLPVEEYVRRWPEANVRRLARGKPDNAGYLFQAKSAQHPVLDALTGGRVAAIRLCILLMPDGPLLHRVTWKLPVGGSMTNHVLGDSGNIRCWVDPSSGRVVSARRGPTTTETPYTALGLFGTPVDAHPDTGAPLVGFEIPGWHRFVDECLTMALLLPAIRYQSWDVTLGPDGPLVLEINTLGGAAQVPGEVGVLDETWMAFERSLK